eukprot:g3405.t1
MAQPSEWKGESWMCRSCVDVVQTWRDTFPCAGANDPLSYCSADELKDPAMLEAIKRSMFPDLSKASALPSKHPRNPTKDMEEQKSIKNFWEHGW